MILDLDKRQRSTIKIKIKDQDLLSRSKAMIIDHDDRPVLGFGRFLKTIPNDQKPNLTVVSKRNRHSLGSSKTCTLLLF